MTVCHWKTGASFYSPEHAEALARTSVTISFHAQHPLSIPTSSLRGKTWHEVFFLMFYLCHPHIFSAPCKQLCTSLCTQLCDLPILHECPWCCVLIYNCPSGYCNWHHACHLQCAYSLYLLKTNQQCEILWIHILLQGLPKWNNSSRSSDFNS